jgi:LysM repeat protein
MTMRSQLLQVLFSLLLCLAMGGCQNDRTASHVPEHTVVAGESLSSIAGDYNVPVKSIVDANSLRSAILRPGQHLLIPGGHLQEVQAPVEELQAPVAKPLEDWYVPRNQWAVDPVILSRTKPMAGVPFRITVHHSGDSKDAYMDPIEWLRLIDRQHMEGLGKKEPWACIGYHFIVAPDGRVFEGRPLQFQGAHAGWDEVNRLNIGVCLIGDFDRTRVPQAQRDGLLRVLDRLCLDYGISRGNVFGHQHWKVTECPGHFLEALVDSYAERTRDDASKLPLASVVQPLR